LRNRIKDFEDAGAQLLVVDPHESYRVRHLLKEAGAQPEELHVPILADPANAISATYGVAFQMKIHTEWSNRPATFVIDQAGVIRSAHRARTYGDRPTPERLLAVVRKLASK